MQPVRNKIAQLELEGILDLNLEVIEGFVFLHLDLETLTPSIIKKLREELDRGLVMLQDRGVDIIFVMSPHKQSVKFWQLIRPCFEIMELEDGSWLGSWITFKDT